MIGNLFSAVALAIFSSVLAVGHINAKVDNTRADVTPSTSWVTGQSVNVYSSGTFIASASYNSTNAQYSLGTIEQGLGGTAYDDDALDYDITQEYTFMQMYNDADFVNAGAECMLTAFASLGTNAFTYNDNYYGLALRVGVNPTSSITGFEFRSNVDMIIFQGGVNGYGVAVSYYSTTGGGVQSVGLYSPLNFGTHFDANVVSTDSFDNNFMPTKLNEYLILFGRSNPTDAPSRWVCNLNLEYQFVNGGGDLYASGYNAGYNTGYSKGVSTGYANGYAEGLSTAESGSFHSLFDSIADTPLRFIYGLFSFDLFGISVLAIIMTFLTGIIVLGIVKKFWK